MKTSLRTNAVLIRRIWYGRLPGDAISNIVNSLGIRIAVNFHIDFRTVRSTLPVLGLIKNTYPYNWFADESGFIINVGNCPGPNSIISREFILRILSIFSQQSSRIRLMRRQGLPIIANIKKPFSSNAIWEHSILYSY